MVLLPFSRAPSKHRKKRRTRQPNRVIKIGEPATSCLGPTTSPGVPSSSVKAGAVSGAGGDGSAGSARSLEPAPEPEGAGAPGRSKQRIDQLNN